MMKINCDIGERGADHPVDRALMEKIQIANIACGGHAGTAASVKAFRELAVLHHVEVAAHLSYPDPDNFGRFSMDIAFEDLLRSLDDQYALMPDVKMIKFHGALYNDCNADRALAEALGQWLAAQDMEKVITPFDSELAAVCREKGMTIVPEAFAERRYTLVKGTEQLALVSRTKEYASIHSVDEAMIHVRRILKEALVDVFTEVENGEPQKQERPIEAQTICIHSDSDIALELAEALGAFLEREPGTE
ncbi:MAG: LamB/YcsF family protein [Spirochaetales bacterium]|nr:LamB/YcsF family protein [Spirochaetales bacterium]